MWLFVSGGLPGVEDEDEKADPVHQGDAAPEVISVQFQNLGQFHDAPGQEYPKKERNAPLDKQGDFGDAARQRPPEAGVRDRGDQP